MSYQAYQNWIREHSKKHQALMHKLKELSDEEIIAYFRYENLKNHEPDFCPLFKENQKCHEMENLNCYLCACPNFRVTQSKSYCSMDSPDGSSITTPDFTHQDCSKCSVPHKEAFIRKVFCREWLDCVVNSND